MSDAQRAGQLTVIVGPMFAGKTTELLRRARAASDAGLSVAIVKSSIDDRYHPERIVAHTGESESGRALDLAAAILEIDADFIALDEAHFFTEGLVDAVTAVLDRGVDVACAGLDRTSFHVPIEHIGRLLCEADEVIKLRARCSVCDGPATHTKRLVDDPEDIVVGGAGMFEPRCRLHRAD